MEEVFRPGFGRALSVILAILGAITLVSILVSAGLRDTVLTIPWFAWFGVFVWAIFWRPSVVVSDAGVRLVNVTRTIEIPWPALTGIDTRYALTLTTAYGRFAAWAAPAPGAGTALRTAMRSRPRAGADGGTSATMGDVPGVASADAAEVVRRRWDRLRDQGFLDDPQLEFETAPIRWHWRIAVAAVGLGALSAATLFVG